MFTLHGNVVDFKSSEKDNKSLFTAKFFDGEAALKFNNGQNNFSVMTIESSSDSGFLKVSLICGTRTEEIAGGKIQIDLNKWNSGEFILSVSGNKARNVSVICSLN